MDQESMIRPGLGYIATLGNLYDARRDKFVDLNAFKQIIPQEAVTMTDNHFSDIRVIHHDTLTEKFQTMDLSPELQVSVLAGLCSVDGSGRFLKDEKTSCRSVNMTLLYKITTKDEKLNIFHEKLKDVFSHEAIETGSATHIVAGITWGANSMVTCECRNTENRDVREIEASLSAQLTNLSSSLPSPLAITGREDKGNTYTENKDTTNKDPENKQDQKSKAVGPKEGTKVDVNRGDMGKGIIFDIRIFGDVLPHGQELPTSVEGALELMKKMPSLVAKSNCGRGKPLVYRLIPISLLKNYLNTQHNAGPILTTLSDASILRVVHHFDRLAKLRQQLNDYFTDATTNKFCIPSKTIQEISLFKEEFAVQESAFRSKVALALRLARSGERDMSALEDILTEFQSGPYSTERIGSTFATWEDIAKKISFANSLIQTGAKYVGFKCSIEDEITRNFEDKAFVLYFTLDAKASQQDLWKKSLQLFLEEMHNDGTQHFAVDCDIHTDVRPQSSPEILLQVIQKGKVCSKDLVKEKEKWDYYSYLLTGALMFLAWMKVRSNKMSNT